MRNESRKKMKRKELMFCISNAMSKSEAVCFARSLRQDEKHYLAKVWENANARTEAKKERYVVLRYPRKGETIKGDYVYWAGKWERETI